MKYVFCVVTIAVFTFSGKKTPEKNDLVADKPISAAVAADSILTFAYQLNIQDSAIVNTSDKQIDILFNNVNGFLGEKKNRHISFRTECLKCEPVQAYKNGLLFAKRLFLTSDGILVYETPRSGTSTVNNIKQIKYYGDTKTLPFRFGNGRGVITKVKQSCNDADYTKVKLSYPKGYIEVRNILNAVFFEYDLDRNGVNEQYLLGIRNCSQELVILRITAKKDKVQQVNKG